MTRIQLIGDEANVGINAYLELTEVVDVPLNFAVSDIRDLSKRTGTFSKSIRVAGTKSNCQILNQLFDVNIISNAATFDINKRQQCLIEQDGIVVLDNALMQLTDVEIVSRGGNDSEFVTYLVTVKDTMADFFTTLGNQRLQDLDFSDFNHTYNSTNVVASFDHDWEDGYKYLLPISDDTTYNLIEMKPAIYARQYWNRLWERAGFRYVWDTIDDVLFNQWLHPYSGSKSEVAEATIEDATVRAENTSAEDYTGEAFQFNIATVGVIFSPDAFDVYETPTETQDNNGYFDPTTFEYTVPFEFPAPNSLTYRVVINMDVILENNSGVNARITEEFWMRSRLQIRKANNTVIDNLALTPSSSYGSPIIYSQTNSSHSSGGDVGDIYTVGENQLYNVAGTFDLTCTNLVIGDVLRFGGRLERYFTPNIQNSNGELVNDSTSAIIPTTDYELFTRVNEVSIQIIPSVEAFGFNFPVLVNLYSIRNMKQSEYVKNIMTMLNLYALVNPNDPKELILKHRDDYYDEGDVKDWNSKLAKDRVQKITFLPELTAKRLKLTYKEDKDVLNVGYVQNVGEIYGEVEYVFDNEYIKNDERKEVTFGASPFVRTPFGATVMGVNGVEPNTLPRVVIDGGKYTCGFYEILDYGTTGVSLNEYPYAGHFDRPVNPSFDLNFGKCSYYFDNNYGAPTDNNLANLFWRRTMAQINSGKLFTGYFYLTAQDIAELNLNDKIYLNGQYWNINKVVDYNANKKQLTKVELLSADESIKLPPFKIRRPSKPNPLDGLIGVPIAEMITSRNRSLSIAPPSVHVIGKNNFVQSSVRNALVVGEGLEVSTDGIHTNNLFVNGAFIQTPVRSYRANITQTSTNAPVVNWENNNLGDVPTWSRTAQGVYTLTLNGAFAGNVYVSVTNAEATNLDWQVGGKKLDDDRIVIASSDPTSKTFEDDVFEDATVIIEIY